MTMVKSSAIYCRKLRRIPQRPPQVQDRKWFCIGGRIQKVNAIHFRHSLADYNWIALLEIGAGPYSQTLLKLTAVSEYGPANHLHILEASNPLGWLPYTQCSMKIETTSSRFSFLTGLAPLIQS